MKSVTIIQSLVIALFCCGFTKEGRWIIERDSSLSIYGATNVNTFVCALQSYAGHDTLHYFNNYAAEELQFSSNRMVIPIQNFDCGSRQISKDFREALKSDTHPYLTIRFISLSGNSVINNKFVDGRMDIILAGVTRRYTVKLKTEMRNGEVVLTGAQQVQFQDFGLTAPQKFSGIIRVKENLRVEFNLVLKPV